MHTCLMKMFRPEFAIDRDNQVRLYSGPCKTAEKTTSPGGKVHGKGPVDDIFVLP